MNDKIQYAIAVIRRKFVARRSVDGIVASINKQVDALRGLAEVKHDAAALLYAESDKLEELANVAVDEAVRAVRTADKLATLVS
jgi:CO dehydrogenase/acetyl-CoA synthase gamma subunit (corrinoid Fe-S protein)